MRNCTQNYSTLRREVYRRFRIFSGNEFFLSEAEEKRQFAFPGLSAFIHVRNETKQSRKPFRILLIDTCALQNFLKGKADFVLKDTIDGGLGKRGVFP